jgi:hypothetical protein
VKLLNSFNRLIITGSALIAFHFSHHGMFSLQAKGKPSRSAVLALSPLDVGHSRKYFTKRMYGKELKRVNVTKSPCHLLLSRLTIISRLARSRITRRRRTKFVGPVYPRGIFNSPLGPCWALWKCPCSTALGSWKGSPERLSKCLGAFHLLNCTTKAVTQAAGLGS